MDTPVVELKNISKYFAKVIANQDVSFSVGKGEVLALLGENGAGKSTIMKCLYGLYRADEGTILIDGQETVIHSPKDAMAKGIAMIQQHFSLVPAHTVTENIILGNVRGPIRMKECREKVQKIAEEAGFEIPVDARVRNLAVGVQQKVEIMKALYINARILIMDEPTAVLTPQESDTLMRFIKKFTENGNSVIFITHKLKEVMEVADRIVVMRDGRVAGNLRKDETDEQELSRLMMGEDVIPAVRTDGEDSGSGEVVLDLQNIRVGGGKAPVLLDGISFQVHRGEVFGIAGVSGNGQDELCEVICGNLPLSEGKLLYCGRDIQHDSIRSRIDAGIGYVPVDRYRDGLIMNMTLAENMMLKTSFDKKWTRRGFIDQKKLNGYTRDIIRDHQVKAPGPDALAKGLSGGNQQKMVLGREIDVGSTLIVFNQPTRGLDMGAVNRIHRAILDERAKGKGILMVSTELSEIFALSDRIAVLYKGRVMGIYRNGELSTQQIGLLMAGYDLEKGGGADEE